jgi:hypothetical protein
VKLLFDENLSSGRVAALASEFPASAPVHDVSLGAAADEAVQEFACDSDFVIVSIDSDFAERSIPRGAPPRPAWMGPRQSIDERDRVAPRGLSRSHRRIGHRQDLHHRVVGLCAGRRRSS